MAIETIHAGIPTGYEQTIDWEALNKQHAQLQVTEAAKIAMQGTAEDPNVTIADAQVDSMGNN